MNSLTNSLIDLVFLHFSMHLFRHIQSFMKNLIIYSFILRKFIKLIISSLFIHLFIHSSSIKKCYHLSVHKSIQSLNHSRIYEFVHSFVKNIILVHPNSNSFLTHQCVHYSLNYLISNLSIKIFLNSNSFKPLISSIIDSFTIHYFLIHSSIYLFIQQKHISFV